MPIRCEIVSQDHLVFEGDVDVVIAPGETGEMGILPNHAPLLTTLKYGVLKLRTQNQEVDFAIAGGIMEVQPHIVTILADAAENVQEIDVVRAEAAKRRVEEILKAGPPPDMDSYLAMEAALKRSNLRLEAARRYRKAGQTVRLSGTDKESS